MKKIYLLFCALAVTCTSFAQTIANPGMETWRSNPSGSTWTIHAPTQWYSFDSLAISGLEQAGPLLFSGYTPTDLKAQLFQENTIKHGGTSSAKLISVKQDTAGIVPGSLANAQPGIDLPNFEATMDVASSITYSGGTGTDLKITSVSAWIEYIPGKDSVTGSYVGSNDSGTFTVQAMSNDSGTPTVVGTGSITIGATPSFSQMTVNVTYTDNTAYVDTVRIIFSSGRAINNLDSSTMYVDDVTMTGTAQVAAVNSVTMKNDVVKVYPNPASGIIHLDGVQSAGMTCDLMSVSGQLVATKTLTGSDIMDVSYLPSGSYFYTVSDMDGNKVQRGKVTVTR